MMSAGALDASERDPLVGQVLGSYRMVRVLGEGGMGRVYEALDLRDERRAALKVLRSAYAAEPTMAGRFLNEARALQKTGHPGVVAIYEAGVELGPTGSTPFIAMEFLEGTSLRDWVASQAGPCKDALLIAKELATVLLAVHERGIIHRDLKPENVMLVPDEATASGYRVKLFDFGIAKVVSSTVPPGAVASAMGAGGARGTQGTQGPQGPKTSVGTILGTPTYMAPEQCGADGGITDKTDVYSLGVILYELLSGEPPFLGEECMELIGKHLFVKPEPLRRLVPEVTRRVSDLIDAMLAKEPRERPGMQAVAAVLDLSVREGPFQSRQITAVGPLPLPPPWAVWPPAVPGVSTPAPMPSLAPPQPPGFWSAPWAAVVPGTSGSGLALGAAPSLQSPRPSSNPALARTHLLAPHGRRQLLLAGWTTLLCLMILGTLLAARRPDPQPIVVTPAQPVQRADKARRDPAVSPPPVAVAPERYAVLTRPAVEPEAPRAEPVAAEGKSDGQNSPKSDKSDTRKSASASAPSATEGGATGGRLRLHRPAGLDLTTETAAAPSSGLSLRPPPWHRAAQPNRATGGHLKNHDIPLLR